MRGEATGLCLVRAMAASSSYRDLLATVKAELVEARGAPQHRTELFQALDLFQDDFQSFLVFPVSSRAALKLFLTAINVMVGGLRVCRELQMPVH